MMSPARRRGIVLVTSGLGPKLGGVGVVSSSLARALGEDTMLWRHKHRWPRAGRRTALLLQAAFGALARPRLVFYEHVDLAAIHSVVPCLADTPFVVFLHGTEVWRPLTGRRRRSLECAAALLANSATTVAEAKRHNPWLPPVTVTHLGIAPGQRGSPAGVRPPVALMVGRMSSRERYKGHAQVLEAWSLIRAAVPTAELVVVGDGDDRPRLAEMAVGRDEVRFAGWVADSDRARYYRSARLFLQPSLREGFGLAALEAASSGTPVLGLRGTVLEELFPEPGTVALSASQAAPDIAAAAIAVLSDGAVADRMGSMAQARVEERFLEAHFIERVRAALAPWID